jgi:hypothetical protein
MPKAHLVQRDHGGVHDHGSDRGAGAAVVGKRTLVEQLGPAAGVIQRKLGVGGEAGAAAHVPIAAAGGAPLAPDLRTRLERLFGTDFSAVRIHRDGAAEQIGARAFARGEAIHLAAGESEADEHLLGHELAHVVQQRQGRVAAEQAFGGAGLNADAGLEREADDAAAQVSRGTPIGWAGGGASTAAAGPVQRKIRLGMNMNTKPYEDWASFWAKVPEPFRPKLLPYQVQITQMLSLAHEVHFPGGLPELFHQLQLAAGGQADNADEVHVVNGREAMIAELPRLASWFFCATDQIGQLGDELVTKQGQIAVLCEPSSQKTIAQHVPAPLRNRVVLFRNCTEVEVQLLGLATQFKVQPAWDLGAIDAWVQPQEKVMAQTPQQRGDMHDARPAMAIDPSLKIAVCFAKAGTRTDVMEILKYYAGFESRVVLTKADAGAVQGLSNGRGCSITYATQRLVVAATEKPSATRQVIRDQTTGGLGQAREEVYIADLEHHGFQRGVPYCIINYRDSGHNPGKGREPSHPEMDTGEMGFVQLCELARTRGFVPVPMGEPPGSEVWEANLIKYWGWKSCQASDGVNKRQAEYGVLRVLAERFNVRALCMRSGATDAMVYAGIETLSLDIASEGASEGEQQQAALDGEYKAGPRRSWRRAAMRDLIFPGTFHQGFLNAPRSDDAEPKKGWKGALSNFDLGLIDKAMDVFFGTGSAQKQGVTQRVPWSPLEIPDEFKQRIPNGERATFQSYVDEINQDRAKLHKAQQLEREEIEARLSELEATVQRVEVLLQQLDALVKHTPPSGTGQPTFLGQ